MSRFQAKSIEITAARFTKANDEGFIEVGEVIDPEGSGTLGYEQFADTLRVQVQPGQWADARIGDWIVRYPNGRLEIIPSDVFEVLFDPITDDDASPGVQSAT
jgi:hypothetical protein